MLNYIKSGECVVVVYLCVMKPLCGKASVWQVSCTDFDFTLCVARLDFCNLVRYAAAATLGLKTRAYDHVCFYRHLNDIPVQKVRDIQIYRGRKVCKKKKTLYKALASSSDFSSSYSSTYVTEWRHISLRRILQRLPAL